MKKNNTSVAIFLFLLFLNSCGTVAEGLGGSKKKGSEEFLVEKKAPLVLPPSFGELPEPGMKTGENLISTKKDTSDIEEIINQRSSTKTKTNNDNLTNSIEESIIKKINDKKIKEVSLEETLNKNIEEKPETLKKVGFFGRLKAKFNNLDH